MKNLTVVRNEIKQIINQSQIVLKKDYAIQFEPSQYANTFKGSYPESAENLVKKLSVGTNRFNNSTK